MRKVPKALLHPDVQGCPEAECVLVQLLELHVQLTDFFHGTAFLLERKKKKLTNLDMDYLDMGIWQIFF